MPWSSGCRAPWTGGPCGGGAFWGGEGRAAGASMGGHGWLPHCHLGQDIRPPVALGTLSPSRRPCGPWTSHPRLPSEPTMAGDLVSDPRPQRAWSPGQSRVWRKWPRHHPGAARGHCRVLLGASGLNIANRVHDRPAQDHDTLPAPRLADASLSLVPAGGHSSRP